MEQSRNIYTDIWDFSWSRKCMNNGGNLVNSSTLSNELIGDLTLELSVHGKWIPVLFVGVLRGFFWGFLFWGALI